MARTIDVFISVRPSPALDELNADGHYWVVVDAMVRNDDLEEYIARSAVAENLHFEFVVPKTPDLAVVPFPDDVDIDLVFEFPTLPAVRRRMDRTNAYRFLDRPDFLDANRSESWTAAEDGLSDINSAFDRSPAFRNAALRLLASRAAAGSDRDFRDLLLRSSGLGGNRLVSPTNYDLTSMENYLMLFDVADGTARLRTNQHSLDGQLARLPMLREDPVELSITLEGSRVFRRLPTLSLDSHASARMAPLAALFSSDHSVPEIQLSQNPVIANRLYAHGRWEEGAKQNAAASDIGAVHWFADVLQVVNNPCAGTGGKSVFRVVAPDADAVWESDKFSALFLAPYRQLRGRLKPYRGFAGAGVGENMVWVFETDASTETLDEFLMRQLKFAILQDSGEVVHRLAEDSPLQLLGCYDFPWEGSFEKPSRSVLFWSAAYEIPGGDVILVFDWGYTPIGLERRQNKLPGEKCYWQSTRDENGAAPEEANCVLVADVDLQAPPRVMELSVQVLRIAAVDFELANSAIRFETLADCMTDAPQMTASRLAVARNSARPGFGAFNDYKPIFSWPQPSLAIAPFRPAQDAQLNPIFTEWSSDLKRTKYHVALRQNAWSDPGQLNKPALASHLYATLGQQYEINHSFLNPLGQRARATENSPPGIVACHFAPILKPTDVHFIGMNDADLQFLEFAYDEARQEIVFLANVAVLDDTGGDARAVAAWLAWKYVAELANAVELTLAVEVLRFDSTNIRETVPDYPEYAPVLQQIPSTEIDNEFSLNGCRQIFMDWLANPPSGPVVEIWRHPLRLKGRTERVHEVASGIRFRLAISRKQDTVPLGTGYDHTFIRTFRPDFNVLDPAEPNEDVNDPALKCGASQWLTAFQTAAFYASPPGNQLVSFALLARSQKDPAPEFIKPFRSPPIPARGKAVVAVVPIAVRPMARRPETGTLTRRAVSRLLSLISRSINCDFPAWRQRWDGGDWTAFFGSLPSRKTVGTPFDLVVDAVVDILTVVPSDGASQPVNVSQLIALGDSHLQMQDSKLRKRLRSHIWSNLTEADKASFALVAMMSADVHSPLPSDLWRVSYVFGPDAFDKNAVSQSVSVTDVAEMLPLSQTAMSSVTYLSRSRFEQSVSLNDAEAMRGAAATNETASGNEAFIEVSEAELPGGIDLLLPNQPRFKVALPPLSQFVPPQFLTAVRRQLAQARNAMFPAAGEVVSLASFEKGQVSAPVSGMPTCTVVANGDTGNAVSRYDASIRVATFKIHAPNEGGASGLASAYLELLLQVPPENAQPQPLPDPSAGLLVRLAGETPLESLDEVVSLDPQGMDYQFYADSLLGRYVLPDTPYVPMEETCILSISFEKSANGVWTAKLGHAYPILWSEICLAEAASGGEEYTLAIALQMPVWHQQPLWLRQSRGVFALDRLGTRFIEHGTVAISGIETIPFAEANYREDPVLLAAMIPELPRTTSPSEIIAILFGNEVIDLSERWYDYESRGLVSHLTSPAFPVANNKAKRLTLFGETRAFPLFSLHVRPESMGSRVVFSGGYVEMSLDMAWLRPGSSVPFFQVVGRKFRVSV